MSLYLMIGLIGLLYILVFGGISLLRREGLSIRFAVESLVITVFAVVLVIFMRVSIHPAIFLIILYIITQRVRILVDLATMFAGRRNFSQADKIFSLASSIGPDVTSRLIVEINRAVMLLQENLLNESISLFTEVLSPANSGYLGMKYEAATHFNLGLAYLRNNNQSLATIEFNSAIDTFPGSLYARRAQQALDRQQHKGNPPVDNHSAGN
jgi:hypothetical protein